MMFRHPLYTDYDDYDDNDYYYVPSNNYHYYDHRRAAEEARRRAQIEQYYRQKALEEEELRRREYVRRLRAQQREEEERRQAYAEAIHRRKIMEEKYRRNQMRQSRGFYEDSVGVVDEDDEVGSVVLERPRHRIIQGPDGRLYRVNTGEQQRRSSAAGLKKKQSLRKFPVADTRQEPEEDDIRDRAVPINTAAPTSFSIPVTPSAPVASDSNVERHLSRKLSSGLKKPKKRVTVVVEDASDSENEDEFRSVWRNRRPSPGQWIEPVEDLGNLNIN